MRVQRVVWTFSALVALALTGCGASSSSGGAGDTVGADTGTDGSIWNQWDVGPETATDTPAGDTPRGDGPPADLPDGGLGDTPGPTPEVGPDDFARADMLDIEEAGPVEMHPIAIVEPLDQATLTGSVWVRIVSLEVEEWDVEIVQLAIDDIPVYDDGKLPTEFVLDTTEYADGPHKLEALAQIGENYNFTSVNVIFENPDFKFDKVDPDKLFYRNGETVNLTVTLGTPGLTVSGDFANVDTGYALGAASSVDAGDGSYIISYPITATNTRTDGRYAVTLTAQDGLGNVLVYSNLFVSLRNTADLPVILEGGLFIDASAPDPYGNLTAQPSFSGAPTGSNYIITGGVANLSAAITDPQGTADVIGLIVAVEGYWGYYQKPLQNATSIQEMVLRLNPNADLASNQLRVRLGLLDKTGNVSVYQTMNMTAVTVMSGDVQVSVSWDPATDVDLHVVEPSGEELYYGHRNSGTGGTLDLDSNAACSYDYVNNENISWPAGQSPAGRYHVLVDYWDDCSRGSSTYTVSIKNCGEVLTFNGTLTSGMSNGGGSCCPSAHAGAPIDGAQDCTPGDCQYITNFDSYCGFVIEGYLRYEDRTFNWEGFRGRTWMPVRYATVEVHRASDEALLGTGYSDRHGYYRVQYYNPDTQNTEMYIVLRSATRTDDGLRDVSVRTHPKFDVVYSFESGRVQQAPAGSAARLDFDVAIDDGAGVLNIFDVAIDGYDRIRQMTGKSLGAMHLHWQTGSDTTDTLYCAEHLFLGGVCHPLDSLHINGSETDRDEFDDCVILRQVYKYAESKVSAHDNPGGPHDGVRDLPPRAFSEGVATFFAADSRRDAVFVNTNYGGVYRVQDLEPIATPWAYGTSNDAMNGRVSEYLVAAVLWDLVDDANEPNDQVSDGANGVYDALFNYIGGSFFGDRGAMGRDFVDFLDGWFCRGHGRQAAVQGVVVTDRRFPYDFAAPISCF